MVDLRGGFTIGGNNIATSHVKPNKEDFGLNANEFWHWTQETKEVSDFLERVSKLFDRRKVKTLLKKLLF